MHPSQVQPRHLSCVARSRQLKRTENIARTPSVARRRRRPAINKCAANTSRLKGCSQNKNTRSSRLTALARPSTRTMITDTHEAENAHREIGMPLKPQRPDTVPPTPMSLLSLLGSFSGVECSNSPPLMASGTPRLLVKFPQTPVSGNAPPVSFFHDEFRRPSDADTRNFRSIQ
jgi:hypothetical protein